MMGGGEIREFADGIARPFAFADVIARPFAFADVIARPFAFSDVIARLLWKALHVTIRLNLN